MRGFFNSWKGRGRPSIEADLRAARPQAPERLVRSIAATISPRTVRVRSRRSLGFVGALGVASLALVGATGGFAYASNAVASAVHATVHFASGPPHPPNTNFPHPSSGASSNASSSACVQYQNQPVVTGSAPSFGSIGSHAVITVKGTNLQNASDVTLAGVDAAIKSPPPSNGKTVQVTLTNSTSSDGAIGPISVTTCAGTGSGGSFTLSTMPNGIGPAGPLALEAGMTLHLTGHGFTGVKATGVKFGTTPSKDASVTDDGDITVTVPSLTKTSGTITVTSPGGTGTGPAFTYSATAPIIKTVALPRGDKVAIADGQTAPATTITVTANTKGLFSNDDTVTVGGAAASNVVWNPDATSGVTSVTFTAGSGTPGGSQTVKITDSLGGASTSKAITIVVNPAPTGGGPAIDTTGDGLFGSAAKTGTIVITGSGLTGVTSVQFTHAAKTAKPLKALDGSVSVKVPADALSGDITVTNLAGSTTVHGFTLITAKPVPAAYTGPQAHPGSTITVTGTGFLGVSKVTVGGKIATITAISADGTSLSFTIPTTVHASSHAAPVIITNPAGTSSHYSISVN